MNSLEVDLSPVQENPQHKRQGKCSGLCQTKPHSPKMTLNPRNSSWPGLKRADSQQQGENQSSAFTLPCPGLDLGGVGDVLLLPDILLLLVVVELLDALVAAGLEQGGVGLQDRGKSHCTRCLETLLEAQIPGLPKSSFAQELGSLGITTAQLLLCFALGQ